MSFLVANAGTGPGRQAQEAGRCLLLGLGLPFTLEDKHIPYAT